jgi:GxxExxY protein
MNAQDAADLTQRVIGCAIEVHRTLGPGLLEWVYETCLCDELSEVGLKFARQQRFAVDYKRRRLDRAFQLDLIVEQILVLEIKSVASLHPIHEAQLRTYLRLSRHPIGLLLNFNCVRLKDGLRRLDLQPIR